jgi:hypothetical protein
MIAAPSVIRREPSKSASRETTPGIPARRSVFAIVRDRSFVPVRGTPRQPRSWLTGTAVHGLAFHNNRFD